MSRKYYEKKRKKRRAILIAAGVLLLLFAGLPSGFSKARKKRKALMARFQETGPCGKRFWKSRKRLRKSPSDA